MPDNLRPYTVSAVVNIDTGELVGTPIVRTGHENYARFETVEPLAACEQFRWVHIWASDTAAAAMTDALTADLHSVGDQILPEVRALTGDRSHRTSVVALEIAVAHREWNRLADLPADARAALVADRIWNRRYPLTYRAAYASAAGQIAARASAAAARNPLAWATLHQLAAAAGTEISRLPAELPAVPPADHQTITAVQAAVATPQHQSAWRRVADLATAGSYLAATLAGTLTAATDVLIGWRLRAGSALAENVTVDGRPARTWVADLLAVVNRDVATGLATTRIAAIHGAGDPTRDRTAAQLAREDQGFGTSPPTPGAVAGRGRRSTSPGSTTTRRKR